MTYKEETKDLFSVSDDYYFVQCISADFAMGKGIAVEFNKRFDVKNKLKARYRNYEQSDLNYHNYNLLGDCLPSGRVLNLITKDKY